jgi:hypothetical protein
MCDSKAQYERQFEKWNLRKYLNKDDYYFLHRRGQKRRLEHKDIYFNGELLSAKKLKKDRARHAPSKFEEATLALGRKSLCFLSGI